MAGMYAPAVIKPVTNSKELLPSDPPIKTRQDICIALQVYGHCLLDVQSEALEDYCS